ncbi:Hypothetical protein (Fragment) [Durusdinium trenchii]|uniref:K Homology domain-containing protein n=1 Tax=Durusdinium trenchii TaxID=1381693 RepID=A0ABP0PPU3_9DINO
MKLTLSGAPDAVGEAREAVDSLFKKEEWTMPSADVFASKHSMSRSGKVDGEGLSAEKAGARRDGKIAEIMQLTDMDSAFILGRGGKTKHKIARVSGASLELHEHNCTVEIVGPEPERRRARKYINLVRAQRVGPVHVTMEHDDGDLTMIPVPSSCVGFVTGSQGNFLRTCEEEWSTLMFFCDYQGPGGNEDSENLAIFGTRAGRTGAELKVMAAIEAKLPSYFTKDLTDESFSSTDWGRDTIPLEDEELSFALGKDGSTRKKLAKASGCIIEYVGNVAFLAGSLPARRRAREYLSWLLKQRTGTVYVDIHGRNDVTAVEIPPDLEASGDQDLLFLGGQQQQVSEAPSKIAFGVCFYVCVALRDSDTFMLRGDISVHVMIQTGPNGEDPVIEDVENVSGTKLTLSKDKAMVQITGSSDKVAQAKRLLQQFADKFVTCHYIRPMPWISTAEVDEQKDLMSASKDEMSNLLTVLDDAAFILGRVGKTKHKIARVSGAQLELHERNSTVEIYGDDESRHRARKYIDLVRAQRIGPVHVDESHNDGDLTLISVPSSCVGFVTGSQGNFLRTCEEEWGTLMFFCDYQGGGPLDTYGGSEKLAIFGTLWARCGAELKVMAAIETKLPGFYTSTLGETQSWDEWGTDTYPMHNDQLSYVLGRKGSTRQKLARASGCIMEYVGNVAFMAGYLPNRRRGREYLGWLCDQVGNKTGRISIDPSSREDVTLVPVPRDCIGYVMGDKRKTLSRLEEDWETLIFFVDSRALPFSYHEEDVEGLAIFGAERGRAGTELKVMGAVETKIPQCGTQRQDRNVQPTWRVDTMPLPGDELSFALGKDGATRRKLARASGCILEYVGNVAYMAGTLEERLRARDYLTWLTWQRTGSVTIETAGRNDVREMEVPEEMRGMIKAASLREVEKESGTFCFFQGDSNSEILLICGHREEGRAYAEELLMDIIMKGAK